MTSARSQRSSSSRSCSSRATAPRAGTPFSSTTSPNSARLLEQPPTAGWDPAMVIEEYMVGASPPPSADFADYLSVESVVVDGNDQPRGCDRAHVPGRAVSRDGTHHPERLPARCRQGSARPRDEGDVGARRSHRLLPHRDQGDDERPARHRGQRPARRLRPRSARARGARCEPVRDLPDVALGEATHLGRRRHHYRSGRLPRRRAAAAVGARVVDVEGLDRLAEYPGVSSVFLSRQPGDEVDWRKGSHEYVYAVLGAAADYEGVQAVQKFIDEEVTVTYA